VKRHKFLTILLCSCLSFSCCEKKSGYRKLEAAQNLQDMLVDSRKNISLEDATNFMRGREKIIDDILTPKFDPYVGAIDLPEECRKENLPKQVNKEDDDEILKIFSLYSSEQKIIGTCIDKEKKYKTHYAFLYCKKNRELFTLKYFYPEESEWITKPFIECAN